MSADRRYSGPQTSVVVIGLGRFGGAVAQALTNLGHDVLGIDEDMAIVQSWSSRLSHVVQADATDEQVLRDLAVDRMAHGVVAIGSDLEASVLSATALVDIGVPDVWAKATSPRHGRVLERVGATHVVYPEAAMGERVAHLVSEQVIDFIQFDDDFAIAKVSAPAMAQGRTLAETALRTRFGITVVGIKRPGADFLYARSQTVVEPGDLLIIAGETPAIQRFAAEAGCVR